jgi:hypothetical protein
VGEIMNRIAEACAELALYRVLIRVDGILEYYSEPGLAAMDRELWKLLASMQASEILTKEAIRKGKD